MCVCMYANALTTDGRREICIAGQQGFCFSLSAVAAPPSLLSSNAIFTLNRHLSHYMLVSSPFLYNIVCNRKLIFISTS